MSILIDHLISSERIALDGVDLNKNHGSEQTWLIPPLTDGSPGPGNQMLLTRNRIIAKRAIPETDSCQSYNDPKYISTSLNSIQFLANTPPSWMSRPRPCPTGGFPQWGWKGRGPPRQSEVSELPSHDSGSLFGLNYEDIEVPITGKSLQSQAYSAYDTGEQHGLSVQDFRGSRKVFRRAASPARYQMNLALSHFKAVIMRR